MIPESVSLFAFGLLSVFLLKVAKRRHFFQFSPFSWEVPLRFAHVLTAFLIYFAVSYATSYLLQKFYLTYRKEIHPIYLLSIANFLSPSFTFLLLLQFWKKLPVSIRSGIVRRPSEETTPLWQDCQVGLWGWIFSFPLILFLSQLLEILVFILFHVEQVPDQIAVQLLKMSFSYPLSFLFTTVTIVLLAPLVEETLFRGFFQTWLRRHLGSKAAILASSACFSLFHYAPEQGLGNIPLIGSLFVLALFLGFVYEKKGSLLAPMTLHASFNSFNIINLYLFGGS